jgi:tRNA G18 (ribose-2'-O)-methylase SpoU
MPIISVDDPLDPRLDDYRILPDRELLRARRRFIAEGRLVVRRLLTSSPLAACSVLVTAPALESLSDLLPRRYPDLPVYVIPQAAMNTTVGFNIHRGCLAAGQRPPERSLGDLLDEVNPWRLVVLEGVSNADNVGGIIRSAAALGGDAVLVGPDCCDPLYRKAIRTSIGATLELPFATGAPWPGAIAVLRERGFDVVACTPDPHAMSITDAGPLRGRDARSAILLGAEGVGLTAPALEAASRRVRIPMRAGIDSLNVTVAAAIAMHRLWPVA